MLLPALAAPHDSLNHPIYPEFPRDLAAMPSVAACDRCHRRKERCVFDAGNGRCHQCRLQQKNCSFSRRGQRMGRPPRMRKLPYGSCEIINFDDDSGEDPKQTTNSPASSDLSCPSPSYDTESESLESTNLSPCRPVAHSSGLPYSSLADLFSFIEVVYDLPIALPHNLDRSSSASPHHLVHDILSNPELFYKFHNDFVIGPTFSDPFRQAIMIVLNRSEGVVLDAYSTVTSLWDAGNNKIKAFDEVDLGQGSRCLKKLQTPAIAHPEDAAAVIMLGQILVVYHIAVLGTSSHAIVRRSLLLVKDWYPWLLNESALHPITITPILVDTVESLVKREIPVVRAPPDPDCSIVDRSAGLCVGLLHLQYEVCRIGHLAKTSTVAAESGAVEPTSTNRYVGMYGEELEAVRTQVLNWEPRPPKTFFTRYTQHEVSAMMMQARVYRLATLLIIHRLRYPLGVEDEPAERLAMAIAAELECFVQWVPDDMKGVSIGFPLLVAMLEIDHISEDAIRYVSPLTAQPTYVEQLRAFVRLTRAARDMGFCGLWFCLVEKGLSIPVLA